MIIQSKNTGIVHNVTKDEWLAMRSRGDHRHYKVIDESDDDPETREIKVEPIELVPTEFDGEGNVTELSPGDDLAGKKEELDEEGEIAFIKSFLDEKGIYYHPNTGIEKLRKKYEEAL